MTSAGRNVEGGMSEAEVMGEFDMMDLIALRDFYNLIIKL